MKNILKIFLAAALIFSTGSCDDFLSYTPSRTVGDDVAYSAVTDMENAMMGVYNTMGTFEFYGRNVVALGDIAADNTWMTGTSGHFNSIYQYTADENDVTLSEIWAVGYRVIDRTARMIKGGKELLASDISAENKAQIEAYIAEAYALKALSHFTLVNIFGLPYSEANRNTPGIIIVDEEPVVAFQEVSRGTVGDTYTQILNDINAAKGNMPEFSSAFYMNKAGLSALEARAKLYMGDWNGAITAANDAIAQRKGTLVMNPENYVNMWFDVVATSEDIFTIVKSEDDNLSANALNTLYGSYNGKATSGLIALFGENDMRLGLFDGNTDMARALKFDGLPSSRATSNIPVFRLGELYLILAEAKAQLGQADAVDALYEVAKRNPDLQKADIPTGKDGLLDFIAVERRRELFQEGHRWFDLRRTGELLTRVGGNFDFSDWDASKFVYPIPAGEVNASGIAQNEGWHNNLP